MKFIAAVGSRCGWIFGLSLLLVALLVNPTWAAESEQPAADPAGEQTMSVKANPGLPMPPLRKAFMGAPVSLHDEDGDLKYLSATEQWIDVDLSEQKVIAFEGLRPVRSFIISSGVPRTPTVTGTFRIRTKVRSQTMSGGSVAEGDYYYLPNVEWVQYFYRGYAFHGAYWHDNFGEPMSHGCINMRNEEAQWLFEWAGPAWNGDTWMQIDEDQGVLVVIHE